MLDVFEDIIWFTHGCVATSLPDVKELDSNTAYALL